MRWILALCIVGSVFAQSRRAYVTELGRRVLGRSDLIVEGKVARLLPAFRGVSSARITVKDRFFGHDRAETLTVMYVNDYVAPDAFRATLDRATVRFERNRKKSLDPTQKPGAADDAGTKPRSSRRRDEAEGRVRAGRGVRLAPGEEGLFFLRRQGASYALASLLPNHDPLYAPKRRRLIATLDLERGGSIVSRAKRAKEFFLDGITDRGDWERGHAAREIRALAERYRGLFTRAEGERLAARLYEENEPPILSSLERAVRAINPSLGLDWARRKEREETAQAAPTLTAARVRLSAIKSPEMRAADLVRVARQFRSGSTQLLIEFLKDPAPIVRERAAQTLAEMGGPSAVKPLREALVQERDANAATAMMYACGVKGDPDAVPVLAKRLADPVSQTVALTALARIGTEAARTALIKHRSRADEETQRLIDRLIREEFPERP